MVIVMVVEFMMNYLNIIVKTPVFCKRISRYKCPHCAELIDFTRRNNLKAQEKPLLAKDYDNISGNKKITSLYL